MKFDAVTTSVPLVDIKPPFCDTIYPVAISSINPLTVLELEYVLQKPPPPKPLPTGKPLATLAENLSALPVDVLA